MDTKLVSVLMPVYNGEAFVERAIQSILAQTYTNWELIISDDASIDKTEEVCRKYDDKRIHYYKQKNNLDIAKNRNFLLKQAKGEFVAVLDADDWATADRLEKQVEFLIQNPKIDVAASWVYLNNSDEKSRKCYTNPDFIKVFMAFKNCYVHSSVMMRNNGLEYSESMDYVEDYELWLRSSLTKNLGMIPEYLCHYTMPNMADNKLDKYKVSDKLELVWMQHFEQLYKTDIQKKYALKLAYFSNSAANLKREEQNELFLIIKELWNNYPQQFLVKEYNQFMMLQVFRLIKRGGVNLKLVNFLISNLNTTFNTLGLLKFRY